MKYIVCLGLIALLGADAVAQRGGFVAGHGGPMPSGVGRAGPRPAPFRRGTGIGRFNRNVGTPFVSGFYPPFFDGDYDFMYPTPPGYPPSPNTIVVEPIQPVVVQQAPARVGNSVVHTYSVDGPATPASEQPMFVIAMGDGSRVDATAVWVQDAVLHYIDADDHAYEIPVASVDRNLTRKLNQGRNLTLRLPAP